jgi:serine phosphatase RsbU (regulator of sigma subunit)
MNTDCEAIMCGFERQILHESEYPKNTRQEIHLVPESADHLFLGARDVYEALCAPPSERLGNFDMACSTVPARYVSGDFTTSFEQDNLRYVALGDLMGKGLPAAMWLTHVVDLLRRSCETGQRLSNIMQALNQEMYRSRICVPLTSLFLAQFDPATSTITYCCGGCPPAFLLGAGETVTMLDCGGPILGAVDGATYPSATIQLELHDTLLAVTDGITEVHHGMNFQLRPDRVANHLRFTAGASPVSIVQSLIARVKASSATISDDFSVMALQRMA